MSWSRWNTNTSYQANEPTDTYTSTKNKRRNVAPEKGTGETTEAETILRYQDEAPPSSCWGFYGKDAQSSWFGISSTSDQESRNAPILHRTNRKWQTFEEIDEISCTQTRTLPWNLYQIQDTKIWKQCHNPTLLLQHPCLPLPAVPIGTRRHRRRPVLVELFDHQPCCRTTNVKATKILYFTFNY